MDVLSPPSSVPHHVRAPREHYRDIAQMSRADWQATRGEYLQSLGMSATDADVVASAEHDTAWHGEVVLDPNLLKRNRAALSTALSTFS